MLRTVKLEDIPKGKYKYGKNVRAINEFLNSDDFAAEVIIKPGENVRNRYASIFLANKRMGNPVMVFTKHDRLFMVKKEKNNAE